MRQELSPWHLAHAVIGNKQRHLLALIRQSAQRRQSHGSRRLTDHPEVLTEPVTEIIPQRLHYPGVVIDHEQNGP
jgi:hypothetical protein